MTRGYTIDEVKPKLLTLDAVRTKLATTEPFGTIQVPAGEDIKFQLNDGWSHGLDTLLGGEPVDAYVDIKGVGDLQLTKDAMITVIKPCLMPKGWLDTYPANIIEQVINWQFRQGKIGKEFKVLSLDDKYAGAIINASTNQFSNLALFERVLAGIETKYGPGEVFADTKFEHSLKETYIRLIIPEKTRVITNTGVDNDTWSFGVQLRNSLIGNGQTSLDAYMFRYWCINGAVDKRNSDQLEQHVWNRKTSGQNPEDAYEWAEREIDGILGGLEDSLDHVQAMTEVLIEGDIMDVLEDLFKTYKIPAKLQESITNNLLMQDNLTMYALMQAVTQAANSLERTSAQVDRLMQIGGELAYQSHDRCSPDRPCGRILSH